MLRMIALPLALAFSAALPLDGLAAGCADFGTPSYSATKTTSGPRGKLTEKVFVSGGLTRSEVTGPEGTVVRIVGPKGMTEFNTTSGKGINLPAPPKPKLRKPDKVEKSQLDANTTEIREYIKARDGKLLLTSTMRCRNDGVPMLTEVSVPDGKGNVGKVRFELSNVKIGPQPKDLFEVPAGYEISSPKG